MQQKKKMLDLLCDLKSLLWKHRRNSLLQKFPGPAGRRWEIVEWLTWQGYWWETLWETPGSWTASLPWCPIAAREHIPGMRVWTRACCFWVHPKRQNMRRTNHHISITYSKLKKRGKAEGHCLRMFMYFYLYLFTRLHVFPHLKIFFFFLMTSKDLAGLWLLFVTSQKDGFL